MSYEPYADAAYYTGVFQGTALPEDQIEKYLIQASRHIDTLTFNRIVGRGFDKLTPFQQETVREVCCAQAEFEYQNAEIFDMILQGYSINGVRMDFGESWNVAIHDGIPMRRDLYGLLSQTGLCCRLARW